MHILSCCDRRKIRTYEIIPKPKYFTNNM